MGRWNAESDRDYYESINRGVGPDTVITSCVRCAGDVEIDRDDSDPLHWCAACERQIRAEQERRRQTWLTGHTRGAA